MSGANIVHKFVKRNPQAGVEGGIKKVEAALDISNVAIVNKTTSNKDKVAIKEIDGKK